MAFAFLLSVLHDYGPTIEVRMARDLSVGILMFCMRKRTNPMIRPLGSIVRPRPIAFYAAREIA